MSSLPGILTSDRLLRSVFITNIPCDISEELLKDLFSEIGPVLNLRLFYDDAGKSKGFCFCEYKDQEMALSAIRNLNGYEIKGRPLHVDIAASDKSKAEFKSLQGSSSEMPSELSGAADSTGEKAPEEISKAVASLPPEQMFELMKQMKMCIENNPQEARNLLLQNPQLAYALLQAQVIMRIVDPEVAMKILNRPTGAPVGSGLLSNPDLKPNMESMPVPPMATEGPVTFPTSFTGQPGPLHPPMPPVPRMLSNMQPRPSLLGDRPPIMNMPPVAVMPNLFPDRGDRDMRQLPLMERDLRPTAALMSDKDVRQVLVDQDFRTQNVAGGGVPDNRPFDPRFRAMQNSDINRPPASVYERARGPTNVDPRTAYEGRGIPSQVRVDDPRKASSVAGIGTSVPPVPPAARLSSVSAPTNINVAPNVVPPPPAHLPPRQPAALAAGNLIGGPPDQEKAALIMQVLQLSDQQIAMLPPEQRQSIMVLKEQIARSQVT